jgi:hypothetical protein
VVTGASTVLTELVDVAVPKVIWRVVDGYRNKRSTV